jgi:hypothetical protein
MLGAGDRRCIRYRRSEWGVRLNSETAALRTTAIAVSQAAMRLRRPASAAWFQSARFSSAVPAAGRGPAIGWRGGPLQVGPTARGSTRPRRWPQPVRLADRRLRTTRRRHHTRRTYSRASWFPKPASCGQACLINRPGGLPAGADHHDREPDGSQAQTRRLSRV